MEDCKGTDILIVTTTVGSAQDADRLAQALVEHRLAACVQIQGPLRSVYRWEGEVRQEPEWRLVIKTTPSRVNELQAFFAAQHPYEVPQFTAWRADASAAYAEWVGAQAS